MGRVRIIDFRTTPEAPRQMRKVRDILSQRKNPPGPSPGSSYENRS